MCNLHGNSSVLMSFKSFTSCVFPILFICHISRQLTGVYAVLEGVVGRSKFKNGPDFGRTAPGDTVIGGAVGCTLGSMEGCKDTIFRALPVHLRYPKF